MKNLNDVKERDSFFVRMTKFKLKKIKKMGAPHNIKRYGEVWPEFRIQHGLEILEKLKNKVIISGGWAWHFMSEIGHTEYKHAHDHKEDIDVFVKKENVAEVVMILQQEGFQKVWTRYDHLSSEENFRRYEKTIELENGKHHRITIDFFERNDLETIEANGFTVVKPNVLLSFYRNIHSSDKCWAVMTAQYLLEKGINPIGHPKLSEMPK
ncbi:nucleotidyltransferase family protein [Chryseobacterium oryctis]|uniref:Nucleotidyltransferase family protein n=1 Tax=Chryseobacterium oryctis TaxID=2952618 RepID=A0ABT3HM60_9FLAO|nr:nucleotidyltransferase family protein [Chryseobacterium oryctis]MCW3160880.1 nucleotidyltransferase family protein [Chryseobacterium oryctis]